MEISRNELALAAHLNTQAYHEFRSNASSQFWRRVQEYAFAATPRSHGQDTLRFYEVLQLGTVPVVLHGPLDGLYMQFPCIILDHWPQNLSHDVIKKWRNAVIARFGPEPFDDWRVKEMLTSSFWAERIRNMRDTAVALQPHPVT